MVFNNLFHGTTGTLFWRRKGFLWSDLFRKCWFEQVPLCARCLRAFMLVLITQVCVEVCVEVCVCELQHACGAQRMTSAVTHLPPDVKQGSPCLYVHPASWPVSFQEFSRLYLPFPTEALGLETLVLCTQPLHEFLGFTLRSSHLQSIFYPLRHPLKHWYHQFFKGRYLINDFLFPSKHANGTYAQNPTGCSLGNANRQQSC